MFHFANMLIILLNFQSKIIMNMQAFYLLRVLHNCKVLNAIKTNPIHSKPRCDCKRPFFHQLHAHILERQQNSEHSKMCAFSWSKHGRSQLPLAEKHFKMNSKPLKWTRDHFFYIFFKFLFCFEWYCGRYIFVCFIWNRFLTTFSFICYKKVLLSILRPSKTTFSYTTRSKTCLRS